MSKHDRVPGETPPAKEAKKFASPSKMDVEKCPICLEAAVDGDIMECIWCETPHHSSCLQLSSELCKVLNTVRNIIFLSNNCILWLPTAFECYVSCVQSEPRFLSVELKLPELQSAEVLLSITVKKIEAHQLTDYHKAVSDMFSKDQSSSSAPISATIDSSINPATVSPTNSTLSILDELADRDRRKKNILVHNLPEPAPNSKGDSEAFAALCSSVYNCAACTVTKSVHLGKELANKPWPLLPCLENEQDKLMLLSRSYLLRQNDSYKNVFIAPDRTKLEREKHRKLASEHRNRRSKGETNLVISSGAITTKLTAGSNTTTLPNTVTASQNS